MLVLDAVAEHRTLAAHFTNLCHRCLLRRRGALYPKRLQSSRARRTRAQRLGLECSEWRHLSSASVVGQSRRVALTLCVPLSREAGEGERASVRPYTLLPQRGRGAGGEGEKSASVPHAANPSAVPLSAPPCGSCSGRGGSKRQAEQTRRSCPTLQAHARVPLLHRYRRGS